MTYLDWAASAPPDTGILKELCRTVPDLYGNPSSLHAPGKEARKRIEDCRNRIASCLSVKPECLHFTSGGTESNNLVLLPFGLKKRKPSVVVSGIEHPSVWEPAQLLQELGCRLLTVPAEKTGHVDPERIVSLIEEDTALVAVMAVSNDTGAVQPLAEITAAVRELETRRGTGLPVHIHTDAVQALGKIPFAPAELDVDSASFSGHKIGAPRGGGLLYVKRRRSSSRSAPFPAVLRGGEQENGLRPGTENLFAVLGMTLAVEKHHSAFRSYFDHARELEKLIIRRISEQPAARLLRAAERTDIYSPYITALSLPPIPGEVLVRIMSDKGFCISTGSACSSAKAKRTRSLENAGLSRETAFSSVRVSTGPGTSADEIEKFFTVLFKESNLLLKSL